MIALSTQAPQPSPTGRLSFYGRRVMVVLAYAVVILICRWLAYQIRFDFNVPAVYIDQMHSRWGLYLLVQMGFLAASGQFTGILRYFSLSDVRRLALALVMSGICLFSIRVFRLPEQVTPAGVILLEVILSLVVIGGLRTAWRVGHERLDSRQKGAVHARRLLGIVGAGDAGASLVRELEARPHFGLVPAALFDDDSDKWGSEVHGIKVVGSPNDLERWAKKLKLEEVVVAMPAAPARRLREIVDLAQKAGLRVVTVPSLGQLATGHVRVSQLRPVKFEDVLGREPVDLRLDEIRPLIAERVVLVTGAGGSIGSELCRQIASLGPRRLLLVEQAEGSLFQIEQELIKLGHGALIQPIVADIVDTARMRTVLAEHRPQSIFHAAAHKHVNMMERQPGEAIKNNAFGTAGLVDLACEQGVERLVLISTDKAVNPTSVMGATKRLAEIYLQGLAQAQPGGTRLLAVRFGNVLGSSGSVVPIFAQQIAEGGPVTVTDPDVVRYFMTIPEAVGLVLQSAALGQGGEIFVLEMGSPVKIVEMARTMIRLSGFEPDRDIEIVFTGLRPGEKRFEELVHNGASHSATTHPRIMQLRSQPRAIDEVRLQFAGLQARLGHSTTEELKLALQSIIPEYTPALGGPVAGETGTGPRDQGTRDQGPRDQGPGTKGPRDQGTKGPGQGRRSTMFIEKIQKNPSSSGGAG